MENDQLKILIDVIQESCLDGMVVPRAVLFSKFENKTNSGIEMYKFKQAISYLINSKAITGYDIKKGRNGGIYKVSPDEKIRVECSLGNFSGYISKKELSRFILALH